jgi:hypothetical protein
VEAFIVSIKRHRKMYVYIEWDVRRGAAGGGEAEGCRAREKGIRRRHDEAIGR